MRRDRFWRSSLCRAITNEVCGSNLTLVNRNERGGMQISKGRGERERGSLPGRMDKALNALCHVCVLGSVYTVRSLAL